MDHDRITKIHAKLTKLKSMIERGTPNESAVARKLHDQLHSKLTSAKKKLRGYSIPVVGQTGTTVDTKA